MSTSTGVSALAPPLCYCKGRTHGSSKAHLSTLPPQPFPLEVILKEVILKIRAG